jgi:hypothetical protein
MMAWASSRFCYTWMRRFNWVPHVGVRGVIVVARPLSIMLRRPILGWGPHQQTELSSSIPNLQAQKMCQTIRTALSDFIQGQEIPADIVRLPLVVRENSKDMYVRC